MFEISSKNIKYQHFSIHLKNDQKLPENDKVKMNGKIENQKMSTSNPENLSN